MNDSNKLVIEQSHFTPSLISLIIIIPATIVCFIFGLIWPGIMFSAFFVGMLDALFRKTATVVDSEDKTIEINNISLFGKSTRHFSVKSEDTDTNSCVANFSKKDEYKIFYTAIYMYDTNNKYYLIKYFLSEKRARELADKINKLLGLTPPQLKLNEVG